MKARLGKYTALEAKQDIARKVYTEYFGQTPKEIPAYHKRIYGQSAAETPAEAKIVEKRHNRANKRFRQ
jgi:hypothetical protein